MKKLLMLLFALILISVGIFLISCNEENPDNNNIISEQSDDGNESGDGNNGNQSTNIICSPENHTFTVENKCALCNTAWNFSQGLEYELSDDETYYKVLSIGSCTDTSITLPYGYDNKPISRIEENAFKNCTLITNVVIPNSVTRIARSAFEGCTSLESIVLPFVGANKNSNETPHRHFGYIFGASNATNNVDFVPASLKSVEITGGSSIDMTAFFNCTSIKSIKISDSVTNIGRSAFEDCTSLESIVLPFVGNTKNGTVCTHFGYIFGASSFQSNVNYVPESLKHVIITGGDSISEFAFFGCNEIISVTVPNSAKSIGASAFENCFKLTSVTIPNSVTSIGNEAFFYCTSLKIVKYRGTEELWDAISKGNRWDEYSFGGSFLNIDYAITYNYTGE